MLIVGLGNPGKEYENTLHNMGYLAVQAIADKLGKRIMRAECSSLTALKSVKGKKIVLAKPLTYMNLSGEAVKSLLVKYKMTVDDLIVIYDDIDIPRYSVRIRPHGSAGTHNGMRSIIGTLGTENFKRIRMGIGRNEFDLKDYVLSEMGKEDKLLFQRTVERTAELLNSYLATEDFDALMREGNTVK